MAYQNILNVTTANGTDDAVGVSKIHSFLHLYFLSKSQHLENM